LFPARWSPYYSWCDDTCWNWQLSLLLDILKVLWYSRIFTYRFFGRTAYTSKSLPHF
jgi:hypothetical protein